MLIRGSVRLSLGLFVFGGKQSSQSATALLG
jgi:hypothetical protein